MHWPKWKCFALKTFKTRYYRFRKINAENVMTAVCSMIEVLALKTSKTLQCQMHYENMFSNLLLMLLFIADRLHTRAQRTYTYVPHQPMHHRVSRTFCAIHIYLPQKSKHKKNFMDKITAESSVCGMNIRNGERCAYK